MLQVIKEEVKEIKMGKWLYDILKTEENYVPKK